MIFFQNQLCFVQKVSIGGRRYHTHQGASEVVSVSLPVFMPPTASAPSSEKSPLRAVLAARSLLQMNILARTLMDGPTDLNPGRRTGVSEFSLQSPHNAQCHGERGGGGGEIPPIQKCRQLIINAAGLPIYRNNTRGSSSASGFPRE